MDEGTTKRSLVAVGVTTSSSRRSPRNTSYMECSTVRRSIPRPLVALAWGSVSTTSTRSPLAARAAARFTVVVDFPTPPFWLAIATTTPWGGVTSFTGAHDKKPCRSVKDCGRHLGDHHPQPERLAHPPQVAGADRWRLTSAQPEHRGTCEREHACGQANRLRRAHRTTKRHAIPLVGDLQFVPLSDVHVVQSQHLDRPGEQADAAAAPIEHGDLGVGPPDR